ncbi:MAG: helix-turn-helix transcriptional regulator [Lachnospiraceae bacterium]|nr:helix-turn-helix transcriptional regulator [Lachnospiraceae bacterium]
MRDLREDHDLTQAELGKILNISQRTYSYYEKGEHDIPPEILVKLALYYNTSIDYLLGLTNHKEPYQK